MAKTERVTLYVSPEQKSRWEEVAASQNRGLLDFIRNCVEVYISAWEKHKTQWKQ